MRVRTVRCGQILHSPTLAAALFVVVCLGLQVGTLLIRPSHDSATWLFMAKRMDSGQMPGRDLWDNKLPLIFVIGRTALASGAPQTFLWLLDAVVTAIAAITVGLIVREACAFKESSRAIGHPKAEKSRIAAGGFVAGLLVCLLSGLPKHRGDGYMTEIYALPISAFAVLVSIRRTTGALRSGVISGLAWGIAVAFRPPLALAALAVTAIAVLWPNSDGCGNSRRPDRIVKAATGFLLGVTLALVVVFAHAIMNGYTREIIAAAVLWPLGWNGAHVPGPLTPSRGERLADWAQDIAKIAWIHVAAIAGLVAGFAKSHRRNAAILTAWYCGAVASAATGWTYFAHYGYVAFAPAVAGIGVLVASLRLPHRRRVALSLVALTGAVAVFQAAKNLLRALSDPIRPHEIALAEWIRTNTLRNDTVFFWIGGRHADVLRKADRAPGVRHFLAYSYLDMDVRLFDAFVSEFTAHPPRWIVQNESRDIVKLIAAPHEGLGGAVASLPALRGFAASRFVEVARFGPFVVHRRQE